jgi:uncharacterized protein (DUF1800 family)
VAQTPSAERRVPRAGSTARDSALHLLNRITYGPRPGDVDRVLALGIDRYIALQLDPDRIPDDAVRPHLERLQVLRMSTGELARVYGRERRDRIERQRAMAADSGNRMAPSPGPDRRAGTRRYVAELQQAVMVRAVLSERQLNEVLADFWTNHFNVFLGKGPVRTLMKEYIEEAVRPHVLGSFEALLIATATSPAMLVYLDNAQSVAEGAEPPRLAGGPADRRTGGRNARADSLRERLAARMPRGLNENYARELLELHTLGVDAGYTQTDVENVARILTGWGVRRGGDAPQFTFNAWAHDRGAKQVLGRAFPEGRGMDEGLELLRWLAAHPSTMRHVSTRLCARFVADDPPDGCIDAAIAAWEAHDGDLRQVVRAVLSSPEFWSPSVRGGKTKTPLEFVASAVRALGAAPDTTLALAQVTRRLGQPLFLESAPTGYAERAESWVNSGALLERLNVAMALAAGRLPGVRPGVPVHTEGDAGELVATVNTAILSGAGGAETLRVMRERAAASPTEAAARAVVLGLALGSPEFQRQ